MLVKGFSQAVVSQLDFTFFQKMVSNASVSAPVRVCVRVYVWETSFLSTHIHGPKLSIDQISKTARVGKTAVKFWPKRFRETPDIEDLDRPSQPLVTLPIQDEKIISTQEADREATGERICKKSKLDVSYETVLRRVKESCLNFY